MRSFSTTLHIHPINLYNRDIYHYNKHDDLYRYQSKHRKLFIKSSRYTKLVQNHHIIPKQFLKYKLIEDIEFDVHSSYNLFIMPTLSGVYQLNLHPDTRTHFKGHNSYNTFVKHNILTLNSNATSLDDKKYNFYLFFHFLKSHLKYFNSYLPWI